ncbi:MAG: protein kinase [Planctomycetes bacterium]|nr:protein kinase [Planctomycetota bacterium]
MRLNPGMRLGPYEIVAPLGAGGMGEVYRGKDGRLGREVAIKVLPQAFAGASEALERFERETKALAALSHPNILAIFDVGADEGVSFAVMELLEGETLRDRLDRAQLPLQSVLEIGAAAAAGLAAAHAKGLVHRDLKPANIFLSSSGQIKILDFGLARFEAAPAAEGATASYVSGLTELGRVMGTAGYMAPEQVRGEPADARADIFALGSVLYEMATGRRAFPGRSAAEVMAAILKDEPAPLEESLGISAELKHVIIRCLDKRPENRFQSAGDLAFILKSLRPESIQPGAGVKESLAPTARPGHRPCIAVLPFQNLSATKEVTEYLVDGMTEALIADLAKIRALKVVSRTTVMQYKDARKPLRQIGRELNADAVVEGSMLHSGSYVRITAQLIRTETDEHLWAESYQRELRDALIVQSEVARAIAHEINVALTLEEEVHLGSARPVKTEAYDAYLKARFHWNRGGGDDLRQAVEYLRQAIALDSEVALSYLDVDPAASWLKSPIWKGGQP